MYQLHLELNILQNNKHPRRLVDLTDYTILLRPSVPGSIIRLYMMDNSDDSINKLSHEKFLYRKARFLCEEASNGVIMRVIIHSTCL